MSKTIRFETCLQHQTKNPEFRREYDALECEFTLAKEIINLRLKRKLQNSSNRFNIVKKIVPQIIDFHHSPCYSRAWYRHYSARMDSSTQMRTRMETSPSCGPGSLTTRSASSNTSRRIWASVCLHP